MKLESFNEYFIDERLFPQIHELIDRGYWLLVDEEIDFIISIVKEQFEALTGYSCCINDSWDARYKLNSYTDLTETPFFEALKIAYEIKEELLCEDCINRPPKPDVCKNCPTPEMPNSLLMDVELLQAHLKGCMLQKSHKDKFKLQRLNKKLFDMLNNNPSVIQSGPQESKTPAPAENSKKSDIIPIDTPNGTKWNQIIFTVRNYEITEIKHPGGTINKRLSEIGLKERGSKPSTLLTMFLLLALNNGKLKPPAGTNYIKPTVHRLRKTLKEFFPGLSGDPIPYIKTNNAWRSAFIIKADVEYLLETMPDESKETIVSYLQK